MVAEVSGRCPGGADENGSSPAPLSSYQGRQWVARGLRPWQRSKQVFKPWKGDRLLAERRWQKSRSPLRGSGPGYSATSGLRPWLPTAAPPGLKARMDSLDTPLRALGADFVSSW